jgi:hypothetical protein
LTSPFPWIRETKRAWELRNRDKIKAYRDANKEGFREYSIIYRERNKKAIKEKQAARMAKITPERRAELLAYKKKWAKENADRKKALDKEYYLKNKEKIKERSRLHAADPENKKRRNELARKKNRCPLRRIKKNLYGGLRKMIGGRVTSREMIYGCSYDFLRKHLESNFLDGMSWDNYGSPKSKERTWHIDHIIPCAAFDHGDIRQVLICWNWQNLRPMWASDNCSKRHRIIEPQMYIPLNFRKSLPADDKELNSAQK